MCKVRSCICLALVFIISGCATPERLLKESDELSADSAYIAAAFSGDAAGFGFGVTNQQSKKVFLMPFVDEIALLGKEFEEEIQLMKVPPGDYKLSFWATYSQLSYEFTNKKPLPKRMQTEFSLGPTNIYFLGRFSASSGSQGSGYFRWTIRPRPYERVDMVSKIEKKFPNISRNNIVFGESNQ